LQKIPFNNKGKGLRGAGDITLPTHAEKKGKIYDQMFVKSEGYASRIPIWHKIAVVDFIFSSSVTAGK
jgi:hypothetical protein